MTTPLRRRAMTLVEAVASLLVVAIMLSAAVATVGAARRADRSAQLAREGHLAADALLGEILSQPYQDATDLTLSSGAGRTSAEAATGNRSLYNDVNDYAGWSASPPQRKDGTAIAALDTWTEAVAVSYLNAGVFDAATDATSGIALVTVTLTSTGGTRVERIGVRSRGLPATERCCLSSSDCRDLSPADCAVAGGTAGGAATSCNTSSCFGPIVRFNFDEGSGTTATDSANGHVGTLLNGATWTTSGQYGGAVVLDGSNDYIQIPHASQLSITGEITITAWVYKVSTDGWDALVSKGTTGDNHNYSLNTNNASVTFSFWNGQYYDSYSSFTLNKNRWYHLAATYHDASNTVKLYRDGVLLTTLTSNGSLLANSEALLIGRCTTPSYFHGRVDDLRIYDRVLDASRILQIMAGGEPDPP